MTLERYLAREGLSQAAFAARLGTTARVVNYWVRGRNRPRLATMAKIEKQTNGDVRMRDFLKAPR